MNSTILSERQAKAIQSIQAETARLGGEYVQPAGRVDSPATKYTLILEAIAQALAGIEIKLQSSPDDPAVVDAEPADEPADEPKATPKASKRKGNL